MSETASDIGSGCILIDAINRQVVKSWGETFECIKKAVEEKFLIHGKGNPLSDFMMKNDSNPKCYLKYLSKAEK